jgi:hypothetical protein
MSAGGRCTCGGGCPSCRTTQTQGTSATAIAIGPADDQFEREAERVSTAVLGGSAAHVASTIREGGVQQNSLTLGNERSLTSGQQLSPDARAFFEPRLGSDLSNVHVHTDAEAARNADRYSARAFTYGADIWFGTGESANDRVLLAHELVHTVQQRAVPSLGASERSVSPHPTIQRQERNQETNGVNVVVIGAPGPHEIEAGHPYQFVNAAIALGDTPNTVWFVEQTGYAQGKVDPRLIERMAPGRLVWITPDNKLVDQLNAFGPRHIASLHVFSHGLPGFVTLRYGWDQEGLANYGFALQDVESLNQDLFLPNAPVRFDSCNTGTSDWYSPEGNLAQAFADRTGRPVNAWTGRTSYSEVNRAAGSRPAEVKGSEVLPGHSPDFAEAGSRLLGRDPQLVTLSPATGKRVGGFKSDFSMKLRLPESRKFDVPANGAVVVTCSNTRVVDTVDDVEIAPDPKAIGANHVEVSLTRERSWWSDEQAGTRSFPLAFPPHAETWSSLTAGTYYLEIWRDGNTNFLTKGDIAVEIHEPP